VYDVVEVISDKSDLRAVLGKKGIVRGISQSEEEAGVFAYAVDIPATKINWFIFEDDLKGTGRKVNPEQVETDLFITVSKDGENLG
jgi:hypothetical protein